MPMEICWNSLTVVQFELRECGTETSLHVVNEIDGVCLRMLLVDLEGPNSGRIVDRCVLETTNAFRPFSA